jgi:hypothetical protein
LAYAAGVDHAVRYQLLDYANDDSLLSEALAVAADDGNWHGPREPGQLPGRRIYILSLTESGGEEFKREFPRANRT